MAVLVLPLCTILLLHMFRTRRLVAGAAACVRTSFLLAILAQGALVIISTEALSLFRAINFGWLLGFWSAVALALLFLLHRLPRLQPPSLRTAWDDLAKVEKALLVGIGVMAVITAVTALVAPPNTLDSLSYHMPRVMRWAQEGSVAFFPTHDYRQNEMSPLAEYGILQLQVLSGGDRFADLVQWFSYVGSMVAASLIAGELGASRRGQVLAAVFVATLPMAILQASSTQTDMVTAFGLACVVLFGIRFTKNVCWESALVWGVSLGFATMTKGTGWMFAFPFGVLFLWKATRAAGIRGVLLAAVAVAIMLCCNAGFIARHIADSGHPLAGPEVRADGQNDRISAKILVSNVVRNLALHANLPASLRTPAEKALDRFHQWLGIGAADPASTIGPPLRWPGRRLTLSHEDYASNPAHLVLIVLALALACTPLFRGGSVPGFRWGFFLCLTAGFLLFCLLIRWTIWSSRYHLPLFVVAAPLVGIVMGQARRQWIVFMTFACLLSWAFYPAIENKVKPMWGPSNIFQTPREQQYFSNGHWDLQEEYFRAAESVRARGAKRIGLCVCAYPEYPMSVLLQKGDSHVEIRHVLVGNRSSRYEASDGWEPDAIVSLGKESAPSLVLGGRTYSLALSSPATRVYVPDRTGD
jgi:hypothetical protein